MMEGPTITKTVTVADINDVIAQLEREALLADGGRPATLRRSNLLREAASLIKTLRDELAEADVLVALVNGEERAMIRLTPPWPVADIAETIAGWRDTDPNRVVTIRRRARSTQDKT